MSTSSISPPTGVSPKESHVFAGASAPESSRNSVRIIHEIFDSYNDLGHEQALMALDNALDEYVQTIIIEPPRLGDETKRWITMGNFLHKCAVLSGFTCLGICGTYPERKALYIPFGLVGLTSFLLYSVSWQRDPCCRYQILTNREKLAELPINGGNSGNLLPVVIVFRSDHRRQLLHTAVSVAVAGVFLGILVKRVVAKD